MNNKTIGLILIAAVAIATVAAAAVIVSGGDDDGGDGGTPVSSNQMETRLTVFGNADGDDDIDEDDVSIIESIINGEKEADYFPCYKTYKGATSLRSFADANADGVIDENDVELVKDIIAKKTGTVVYFYDVDGVIAHCTYPLGTCAVGYKSNYEALSILGASDTVRYICDQVGNSGSYAKWYSAFINSNTHCYGSRFTPDYEVFTNYGAPDYLLTGTRAWFASDAEDKLSTLGTDVVRLPFWEDNEATHAIVTLGFLIDRTEQAQEYIEKADAVYKTIADATADIALEDRPFVYASYNATSISTMHNGIHELITLAGGRTPIDEGYPTGQIDVEAVRIMDPDWIVLDQYYGFLETFSDNASTKADLADALKNTDLKYIQAINMTDAYKNGNVLFFQQGVYMGPASYIACAYLANHLYPDKFSFDVDAMFEDYVASYHSDLNASDYAGIEYFDLEALSSY